MALDELAQARLRQAYITASETTQKAIVRRLASEFGISEPTVRRYAKSGEWDAIRSAADHLEGVVAKEVKARVKATSVKPEMAVGGEILDTSEMLSLAIHDLYGSISVAQTKSKEGAASSLARLIELYRKFNPITIDELVDLALSIPGFDPVAFARRLRERIEKAG